MEEAKKLRFLMGIAALLSALLIAVVFLDAPDFPLPTFFIDQPADFSGELPVFTEGMQETQVININTATVAQLDTLPGIGEVTARRIVAYRESIGGFTSVEQLTQVERIGEKTLEKLLPYITID